MKRLFTFLASFIISLFLFSCSDINVRGVVYEKEVLGNVNMTVKSLDGSRIFESSFSRTILQSPLDGTHLNYHIYYIDTLSSSTTEYSYYGKVKLTYMTETEATASINFLDSVYRFALFALENEYDSPSFSTAQNNACLEAFSIADLRSVNTVSFYLSTNNYSGSGHADISISSSWSFPSAWNFDETYGNSSVTIGIYDIKTGEPVHVNSANRNVNPHRLSYSAVGEINSRINLSNYTFDSCSFPTGTYSFVIKFYNSDYNVTYEYSDLIQILRNQTSTALIEVPDIIELPPEAPENFSYTLSAPENDDESYYLADFTWSDKANNESGYEIQIADVSCNRSNLTGQGALLYIPSVNSDSEWNSTVNNAVYSENSVTSYNADSYRNYISFYYNYFNSDSFNPESYSLLRNNEQVRFYFQLGKRYIARIRAVNDAGYSDWVYIDYSGTSYSNSINLFQIRYEKENGTEILYYSQNNGSGVTIETPSASNWNGWYVSYISDDTKYPDTASVCDSYTGHENLSLVGSYTVVVDEDYAWNDDEVILYGMTSEHGTVYFNELDTDGSGHKTLCKKGLLIEIDRNTVKNLQWALSSDGTLSATGTGATTRYDVVTLEMRKISTQSVVSTQVWNKDLYAMSLQIATWEAGYYMATFKAEKGSDLYYFEMIFRLTE